MKPVADKLIICLVIFFITSALHAQVIKDAEKSEQKDIQTEIGELLNRGDVKQADIVIDKYLKENPESIDALVAKGNVILHSQYLQNKIKLYKKRNDSVFDDQIPSEMDGASFILSRETALEVARYWEKALTLDTTSMDMYKGLCLLYSSSLMKNELVNTLIKMKTAYPEEDLKFIMGEYAQEFYRRGEIENTYAVYQEILKMFPEDSGIYCDLAAVYSMEGNLVEAQKYVDLAVTKKNPDQLLYENYFIISLLNEEYIKAVAALKGIQGDNLWQFYAGLNQYYNDDANWKKTLLEYKSANPQTAESKIASYLLSDDNYDDLISYQKSLQGGKYVCYLPLGKRAVKKFPDKSIPYINYGVVQSYYKNYLLAEKIFKEVVTRKIVLSPMEASEFNFYYAWTLQMLNKKSEANVYWESLLKENDLFKQSAAAYFLGMYYQKNGDKKKSLQYFQQGAGLSEETKFKYFCNEELKSFKLDDQPVVPPVKTTP